MNLLQRAEILCLLSVLERVRIIEGFFRENVWEFWKLSPIERCPYREVQLCCF